MSILSANRDDLARQFGVRHLALFGSTARDQAREESDVDILVEFEGPATYNRYLGLLRSLERLLSKKVDLVTVTGLKPRARALVERELVSVA